MDTIIISLLIAIIGIILAVGLPIGIPLIIKMGKIDTLQSEIKELKSQLQTEIKELKSQLAAERVTQDMKEIWKEVIQKKANSK